MEKMTPLEKTLLKNYADPNAPAGWLTNLSLQLTVSYLSPLFFSLD
jgi:hypothetical protein